jgi:hypothetical protein
MFGEGWIDPEGDKVNFYVHTQMVGEEKVCRMNARSRIDVVSYKLLLGAGKRLWPDIVSCVCSPKKESVHGKKPSYSKQTIWKGKKW